MIPFRPEASCPLDGMVVLDLSRLVAGNMLSLQLADFGAEVIKVEDPGKGDPLRHWQVQGHSLFWKAYARNKKSLTLDLRTARAKELCSVSSSAPTCWSRTTVRARWSEWDSAQPYCTPAIRAW